MKDNEDDNRLQANKKKDDDCWNKKGKDCGPQRNDNPFSFFKGGKFKFSAWYFFIALLILMFLNTFLAQQRMASTVSFSEFKQLVRDGQITQVQLSPDFYYGRGTSADGESGGITYRTVPVEDPGFIPLLDEEGISYSAVSQRGTNMLSTLISWILPLVLLIFVWRLMFKRMGNMGSDVMTFGKNRSQIVAEGQTGVTFADVAGADEAKEELEEVVDFLKNPRKYTVIGGKVPKGVLLVGSPGTGKTLLARAVAGNAGVPFFRMSGADFVEMFVGVGAARVRDLFKQAREKAPCIVFIDELDAIGKSRLQVAAGNDEREQTLNQLLVEMDGFDATTGVIILAATNRPEVLDPALLRPGRFDRQIVVDKPDLEGREAILKIHSKDVKLAKTVNLREIAKATPGFVGADLANVINEAALLAVRSGRTEVLQEDLQEAIEKAVAGLKKKNRLINPKEREIVAYHETGHALTAAFTEGADPVQKITIVPRGIGALGYTMQTPVEDRYLMTEEELLGKIDVLLGGRAAEKVKYGSISTGAANDLSRATDIARKMVTDYGMSDKFHNVALTKQANPFLGDTGQAMMSREYSEDTQTYVDQEIARIVAQRYDRVVKLLESKQDTLEAVAQRLLEKETLEAAEFASMTGLKEKQAL
ncbi:MAG: ATP-dependent zinc metalloprotease FtsH [Spirochaetales bacterium]|nr:ATP-dependent zinc metalloprotease FtsH [Spirochaetales bacterium]